MQANVGNVQQPLQLPQPAPLAPAIANAAPGPQPQPPQQPITQTLNQAQLVALHDLMQALNLIRRDLTWEVFLLLDVNNNFDLAVDECELMEVAKFLGTPNQQPLLQFSQYCRGVNGHLAGLIRGCADQIDMTIALSSYCWGIVLTDRQSKPT